MIINILIVLIIIALCGFIILNELYKRTNDYRNKENQFKKFNTNYEVSIINTGSTFAEYAYDYNSECIKGLNLALSPQCLLYDCKMLKNYKNLYCEGATVLITISDLAFGVIEYNSNNYKNKYYKLLKPKYLGTFPYLKIIRNKYFPVTLDYKNYVRFLKDKKIQNDFNIKVNESDIDHVKADAYSRCKNWCREFQLSNLKDPNIPQRYEEIFNKTISIVSVMIEWCLENGYKPVLVNLPISNELNSYFSEEFLKVFYYNNIEKANTRVVPFIDLNKEEKLRNYLLFLDSCRLNKSGRQIVTKVLIKKLKDLGYEFK